MAQAFALLFAAFLLLMVGLKYWLAFRQIRHVTQHADRVPAEFSDRISLEQHQRAAAYTVAKQRFGLVQTAVSTALLVALTLMGGLQWISEGLAALVGTGFLFQVLIVGAVVLLVSVLDIPFEWHRQFRIEQAFGFNRMTTSLFVTDALKSLAIAAIVGLPLLAIVLWLMQQAGSLWWLYAWAVWIAFNVIALIVYPIFIAPLFNRFEPLQDASLVERIEALLARTGFSARGIFVMDGSRRSSHGNAYFAGLGRSKRIVFFDTLVERLHPSEIEAVLAHELGHFKRRHLTKRLLVLLPMSLGVMALLGWLANQAWFYQGLGVEPFLTARNDGIALILFVLVLPVFTFVLAPLGSLLSRRQEFEADEFAARHASAQDLVSALVKLFRENAATLTPDPLHSAFYDSHPPASIRIRRLTSAAPAAATA